MARRSDNSGCVGGWVGVIKCDSLRRCSDTAATAGGRFIRTRDDEW